MYSPGCQSFFLECAPTGKELCNSWLPVVFGFTQNASIRYTHSTKRWKPLGAPQKKEMETTRNRGCELTRFLLHTQILQTHYRLLFSLMSTFFLFLELNNSKFVNVLTLNLKCKFQKQTSILFHKKHV